MGHAAEGIEPGVSFSEHASREAGGTVVVHSAGWNEMQFSSGSFDLITCLHVLEHLNRPREALEKMADWLAPGGVLFVEVPNMEGYSTTGFDRLHFAHTLGFSRDNLIHVLQQSGFAVLHERGPTSIFCVKDGDPRGVDTCINLAAAAARIKSSYSEPFNMKRYLARHANRLRYVIGNELGR
jgi:SAM-dependent methyltransferase